MEKATEEYRYTNEAQDNGCVCINAICGQMQSNNNNRVYNNWSQVYLSVPVCVCVCLGYSSETPNEPQSGRTKKEASNTWVKRKIQGEKEIQNDTL